MNALESLFNLLPAHFAVRHRGAASGGSGPGQGFGCAAFAQLADKRREHRIAQANLIDCLNRFLLQTVVASDPAKNAPSGPREINTFSTPVSNSFALCFRQIPSALRTAD